MSTKPRSRAMVMFCCIDRPTNASFRPFAIAAWATCCTRCRCDAKLVTMNRLSGYSRNSDRIATPTVDSDGVKPGRSAFVESDIRSRMPPSRLAMSPSIARFGAATVDRREIELEVAAVHDGADRREERDREAVRHRVRHRDELAVDRADPPALPVFDRDQLGAVEHAGFFDAVAGERERQRRAVDRNRDVTQQERDPARVVFVGVREQDRFDAIGVLAEIGEVGQDQVDAGHVGVGEHDPAVDEQDAIVDLDAAAIAADLAQPAEEHDAD